MKISKKLGILSILLLLAVGVYGGVKLTEPSYILMMDVNPSIEIVSNRLDRVVEVKALNDDAKEMLKDFSLKNKNLESVIEDLADLMVLKGYITGGKDNFVMISVNDSDANKNVLDKLNTAIAAYLENKQIEATIVNQSISEQLESNQTGRQLVAKKISNLDDDIDYDKIANMTLRELVSLAETQNISLEDIFTNFISITNANNSDVKNKTNDKNVDNANTKELIGDAKAKEIALELVEGKIVEFELDNDDDHDDNPEYKIEIIANGYKYEIEIDGYTGKVLEFEKDDKDDDHDDVNNDRDDDDDDDDHIKKSQKTSQNTIKNNTKKNKNTKELIGDAKAKEIALGLVKGKIVDFDLDDDDDDDDNPEYEIEIIADGYEYEIVIDGYTGKVLEFEKED